MTPSREQGSALIVVLLAIVMLLPPTLVLATLAIRWQRQSLDYRDTIGGEFVAHAAFEQMRNRIAGQGLDLAPNEGTSFALEPMGEVEASARVARVDDVIIAQDGRLIERMDDDRVDLDLTGTDAEGRVVYRYRKLELYVVQVDVTRRPTMPAIRLHGIVAKLPDGTFETLGLTLRRGFFDP